jgi:hypothetical protein
MGTNMTPEQIRIDYIEVSVYDGLNWADNYQTTDAVQQWERTVGCVADWYREHPGAVRLKDQHVSPAGKEYVARHLRRPEGFASIGDQEYALFTAWNEPNPLIRSTAGVKTSARRIS